MQSLKGNSTPQGLNLWKTDKAARPRVVLGSPLHQISRRPSSAGAVLTRSTGVAEVSHTEQQAGLDTLGCPHPVSGQDAAGCSLVE
jgi:hypothetical protein